MAGEIPRVWGGASRWAPRPFSGPPVPHVLYNVGQLAPVPIAGPAAPRHGERAISRATEWWGRGFVAGKVTIEGSPASRNVRLFDARSALVVASAWSAPDGSYRFDWIDPKREYLVVARDHLRQFNAVVCDWVRPEEAEYS